MKRSRIVVLLVVAVLAGAVLFGRSWAQNKPLAAGATKVAVCDIVQVFNNYTRATDLTSTLNQRRDAIKAENEKRGEAIEAVGLELEGLLVGSKEYEQRFVEAQRLTIEREAWMRFQEATVMRDHHRLTREMYDEIIDWIGKIALQRDAQIVLYRERGEFNTQNTQQLLQAIQTRKVLYASSSVDLTDIVLKQLNEAYKARTK